MSEKTDDDAVENHVSKLHVRVDTVEKRLGQVEHDVSTMRTETKDGFKTVLHSINGLAVEFGTRMNTLDQRIVDEKAKWGDTLRSIVLWSVRVLLSGALAAMGVTICKNF